MVVPPLLQQDNGKLTLYVEGRLYTPVPVVIICRFCRRALVKGLNGKDGYRRRRRRPVTDKENEKI